MREELFVKLKRMKKLNREINRIIDKENRTIATDSLRIVILLTNFSNLSIEIIIL